MSRQRATNEALKAWMASRPESEQQGVALKARLRALATREKQKWEARRRGEVTVDIAVHGRRASGGSVTA